MAKKKKKKGTDAPAPAYPSEDKSWRARDDLSTLTRAQEVVKDSARFSAAKAEAKRQTESLARIRRLDGKTL